MQEAAGILDPIRDEVVVIGALAVQIALDGHDVALTPTRDIDAGVSTDAVARVVAHLEANGLRKSDNPHERSFTWSRSTETSATWRFYWTNSENRSPMKSAPPRECAPACSMRHSGLMRTRRR